MAAKHGPIHVRSPGGAPEQPVALSRVHLAQDPVGQACCVDRKVVDSHYARVEPGNVVLHCDT